MTVKGFQDRLAVSLTLTLGSTAHTIPQGNIKFFELELRSWGLEGRVEFLVVDNQAAGGTASDAILTDFLGQDLAEVSLELKTNYSDLPSAPPPTSLEVKGLVIDKSLVELPVADVKGAPLVYRRYSVRFQDAARLLWSQHYPCVLYTQKTMKDVLEAHKGEKISLTYDWQAGMETTLPMIFLGHSPEPGAASFYDFLLWYIDTRNGVLSYDYSSQGYAISETKDSTGTAIDLQAQEVAEVEVIFPEIPRYNVSVLNSYTESPKTEDITQEQAASGIRQDVLLRTPIDDDVTARKTLETARLKLRGMEAELVWRRFPATAFAPGALVKLPSTKGFAAAGVPASETFRVRSLHVRGEAIEAGPDAEHQEPNAGYHFSMSTRLELKDETYKDPYGRDRSSRANVRVRAERLADP